MTRGVQVLMPGELMKAPGVEKQRHHAYML